MIRARSAIVVPCLRLVGTNLQLNSIRWNSNNRFSKADNEFWSNRKDNYQNRNSGSNWGFKKEERWGSDDRFGSGDFGSQLR